MSDTVAVALIAGLAGVGGSVVVAFMQSRATLRQIDAKNERVRALHDEDHLRHRQGVYHELLTNLDRFHIANQNPQRSKWSEGVEVVMALEHSLNSAVLFGDDNDRKCAADMGALTTYGLGHVEGFEPVDDEVWQAAHERLVDALRADSGR